MFFLPGGLLFFFHGFAKAAPALCGLWPGGARLLWFVAGQGAPEDQPIVPGTSRRPAFPRRARARARRRTTPKAAAGARIASMAGPFVLPGVGARVRERCTHATSPCGAPLGRRRFSKNILSAADKKFFEKHQPSNSLTNLCPTHKRALCILTEP